MSGETSLVPGRECGECQVCCIALTVDKPEIQKMPGSPCCHSLAGGCDIYENRPDVCRVFFCGWRKLAAIPADWRPDESGILVIGESNELPQYQPVALNLFLTGNPLKAVRRPDFLDFVLRNARGTALYLMLPGGKAMKPARLHLNPSLAGARSRADVKAVLEQSLKTHRTLPSMPYVMENAGHDFSS
jgi:hypothetical protein